MFQVLPSFDCEGLLEIFEIRSGVIESFLLISKLNEIRLKLTKLAFFHFLFFCLLICVSGIIVDAIFYSFERLLPTSPAARR